MPDSGIRCDLRPSWVRNGQDEPLRTEAFSRIFRFYVIDSPCKDYATRGRTLQYHGWDDYPWRSIRYLKNRLDACVSRPKSAGKLLDSAGSLSDLAVALRKAGLEGEGWRDDTSCDRLAFYDSQRNAYMSIFHHVRCALAHGRVLVRTDGDGTTYFLENGERRGNSLMLKARFVIAEETLLAWASLIEGGPSEGVGAPLDEVLRLFMRDRHMSAGRAAEAIGETQYMVEKALNHWKQCRVLRYKKKGPDRGWMFDQSALEAYRRCPQAEAE